MKLGCILSVFLSVVFFTVTTARAVNFPSGPIVIISPYAPGDAVDNVARVFAESLGRELNGTIVVQNVTGGSGIVGMKKGLKAKPDGQVLVMAVAGALINAPMISKPGFTSEDFTPLAKLTELPFAIAVAADSKYEKLNDLVKDARENVIKFSTPGASSTQRMVLSDFAQKNGFKPMIHIAGQGGSDTVVKLLTGEVDIAFTSTPVFYPLVKAGKLRLLAVGSDERVPYLDDQPTFKEQNYEMTETLWFGLIIRNGVAPEILSKLNAAIKNVCEEKELEESLAKFKIELSYQGPDEFKKLIQQTAENRHITMQRLEIIKKGR